MTINTEELNTLLEQPLSTDPGWKQVNSQDWTAVGVSAALSFPPSAYARGFENGAQAMASTILDLMSKDERAAVRFVYAYANGFAKATRGWQHSPPSN